MPKISVIVPVHNTERFLGRCLDSIINQTEDDIEIILIDDASTDNSLEIISSYQEKYKEKIKVAQTKENVGAGTARNIGLDLSTGAYIGFVDSDDYILPTMYEKLLDRLETTGADIVRTPQLRLLFGFDLSKIRRKQPVINDQIIIPSEHESFLIVEPPGVTNKLFTREIIGNRKFPDGLKWEDYPFTVPLLVKATKVASANEKLYVYNMHLNNTTLTDARKLTSQVLDIFSGSDMIGEECFSQDINDNVKRQLEYIQMKHCISRLKEVAGASIPLQEKRELLTLLSELIKVKYGPWQDHTIYQSEKRDNFIHKTRMAVVETLLLPSDAIPKDETAIKQLIKEKVTINT